MQAIYESGDETDTTGREPEMPLESAGHTISYDENTPAGTVLGKAGAAAMGGVPLAYAIIDGNDHGGYAIDAATGEIMLTPAGALAANDFDAGTPVHRLRVSVSDGSNATVVEVTLDAGWRRFGRQ